MIIMVVCENYPQYKRWMNANFPEFLPGPNSRFEPVYGSRENYDRCLSIARGSLYFMIGQPNPPDWFTSRFTKINLDSEKMIG